MLKSIVCSERTLIICILLVTFSCDKEIILKGEEKEISTTIVGPGSIGIDKLLETETDTLITFKSN